jgi:PAS domain S-box-containing protein
MAVAGPAGDALFEQAACGLVVTDADGLIIRANATFCAWLGFAADQLAGARRLQDLYTVGGRVFNQTHLAPLLQMQGSVAEVAVDLMHRDGHTLPVLLNIVRKPGDGTFLHHVSVVIVADRKKYERELLNTRAQLRELNETLSQADRNKDEFLATLAHELRNPLAPMQNVLQVLAQMNLGDPKVNWCREVLARQVTQMTHLVDDLLEVSRITEGKLELQFSRVDLTEATQAAVEGARPLIQSAEHELTVTSPGLPIWLNADPTRVVQIIQNLLNNAAKYTPRGGKIHLSTETDGDSAVIRVRDNGIGIPATHLTRIFEKFSQVESARSRSQGGLGIGLSLVRALVDLHGGAVAAQSDGLGKGSEFTVRLPVAREPAPGAAPARREATEAPRKILVVDDSQDIVDSMAMLLTLRGHELCTANSGAAALEAAAKFRPEVIVLDIGLPDMDGYEVARRLRGEPWGAQIVLVALTGWGQKQDKEAAAAAGFDHHLTKPLGPNTLADILK